MDWLGDHQWAAWVGISVVLAVLELLSLDLIFLMLALGALGGMVTSLATDAVVAQVLVAAGVSLATLLLVRPSLVRRLHSGPDLVIGHERLMGAQGVVTEAGTAMAPGRARISGEIWTVAPYDETLALAVGETVQVMQIRGATAYVHPIPTLDP